MPTLKEIYTALKADGAPLPDTYEGFETYMTSGPQKGYEHRKKVYDALKADGAPLPDTYEKFTKGWLVPVKPKPAASSPQPTEQPKKPTAQEQPKPKEAAPKQQGYTPTWQEAAAAQMLIDKIGLPEEEEDLGLKKMPEGHRPLTKKPITTTFEKFDKRALGLDDDVEQEKLAKLRTPDKVLEDAAKAIGQSGAARFAMGLTKEHVEKPLDTETYEAGVNPRIRRFERMHWDSNAGEFKKGYYMTEDGQVYGDLAPAVIAQNKADAFSRGDLSLLSNEERADYFRNHWGGKSEKAIIAEELEAAEKRKAELEKRIEENKRKHGNPLTSYAASIGAPNNRGDNGELTQLENALAETDAAILSFKAAQDDPGIWRGLVNTAGQARTWDFGMRDLAVSGEAMRIAGKLQRGEQLTDNERLLAEAAYSKAVGAEYEDKNTGKLYRWAKIAGESLPFMLDMFLTRGMGGAATKGARAGLKLAAKKGVKGWKAGVLKNTGVAAGDLAASLGTATTVQAAKTIADITNRNIGQITLDDKGEYAYEGGESIGKAIGHGIAAATIENYTERLGEHLPTGKLLNEWIAKAGMKRASQFFTNVGNKGWYKATKRWSNKFGIQDFASEVLEEEIGIPLNAIFTGDNEFSDLFDTRQQGDIFGGMLLSVGAMKGAALGAYGLHKGASRIAYNRGNRKLDTAASVASWRIGDKDRWNSIKERIDNATNEQLPDIINDIVNDPDLHIEQKKAIGQYVQRLTYLRGFNLGQVAAARNQDDEGQGDETSNAVTESADQSYTEGHDAATATQGDGTGQGDKDKMADIKARYEVARAALAEDGEDIEDVVARLGYDSVEDYVVDLAKAANSKQSPYVQRLMDFINAKYAYEGMLQGVRDNMDDAIAASNAMIDRRAHTTDGMVHPITLKAKNADGTDRKVYIRSGHVVLQEDGKTIDTSVSSPTLVVVDEQGKAEMIAPSAIYSVDEPINAEEEKQTAANALREQYARQASDNIDGKITPTVGGTYTVLSSSGELHAATVTDIQQLPDGTTSITVDIEGEYLPVTMTPEQLQQTVDAARQKRLEQEKAEQQQKRDEAAAQGGGDTEQQPQGTPETAGTATPTDYQPEDRLTLRLPDGTVTGAQVTEVKPDGTVELMCDQPIGDHQRLDTFTREELDPLVTNIEREGEASGQEGVSDNSDLSDQSDQSESSQQPEIGPAGTATGTSQPTVPQEGGQAAQPEIGPAPTALSQIPTDDLGNPIYEQATPEQVWDAIVEQAGGDTEMAQSVADDMVRDKEAALKRAEKWKPKGGNTVAEKLAAEKRRKDGIAQAQAELDHWRQIAARGRQTAQEVAAGNVAEGVERQRSTAPSVENAGQASGEVASKFQQAPKVEGFTASRTLADGTVLKGTYMVVPAESLTPSHDAINGYKRSEGFPVNAEGKTVNDRDYEHNRHAQEVTDEMAYKYDGHAVDNPPTVSDEGIVYDGNGRTMAGQKAAALNRDGAYVEYLKDNAPRFGVTREQIEQSGIAHPRIVFVPNERLPYTTAVFARFNKEDKKKQSNTQEAVAMSKSLTPDEIGAIAAAIEGSGTIESFFDNKVAIKELFATLVQKGIVGSNELGGYVNDDGVLQPQGKELIKNIMLGSMFSEDTIRMMEIEPSLKSKVIQAMRTIMANAKLGEYSLREEIDEAIQLLYEAKRAGQSVDYALRETGMFEENAADRYPPIAQLMALTLEGRVADFRDLLESYNHIAEHHASGMADAFIPKPTKEELINEFLKYKNWEDYGTRHQANKGNAPVGGVQADEPQTRGGTNEERGGNAGIAGERQEDRKEDDNISPIGEGDFGPIYDQFKGDAQGAIAFLTEKQGGEAVGALHHKDIGNIDLVWGVAGTKKSDGYGLSKLVKYHPEVLADLQGLLDSMHVTSRSGNRVQLANEEYQAAVRLTWEGQEKKWLLTAFKKNETSEPTNSRTDVDSNLEGKSDDTATRQRTDVSSAGKGTKAPGNQQGNGEKVDNEAPTAPASEGVFGEAERIAEEERKRKAKEKAEKGKGKKPKADKGKKPKADKGKKPKADNKQGEGSSEKADNEKPDSKPKNPSGNKIISDERYEELKRDMRMKLLGQLNANFDPDILSIGAQMAVYHIERGLRTFAEFAKAMIEELGDAIRPYLKGCYDGARRLPGIEEYAEEMTPFDEVTRFDVDNFDKPTAEGKQDAQGNPLNADGTLKVERISSIDELTDEDFTSPTRNVELPTIPKNVDEAIGANGKPVVIKKNIFEKNADRHKDLSAEDGRKILHDVFYSPDLYGQNQKKTRPYNWILIHLADKNEAVVVEVSPTKENVEVVNWHYLGQTELERKKRQATKEGGLVLTLPKGNAAADTLDSSSSAGNITESSRTKQERDEKNSDKKLISAEEFDVNEIDFDNNYVIIHQTLTDNALSILRNGLRTPAIGLNGTALFANRETITDILHQQKNGNGHRGATSLVIMQFPKSEFKTKGRISLDAISDILGEKHGYEAIKTVPSEYITHIVASEQSEENGVGSETSDKENAKSAAVKALQKYKEAVDKWHEAANKNLDEIKAADELYKAGGEARQALRDVTDAELEELSKQFTDANNQRQLNKERDLRNRTTSQQATGKKKGVTSQPNLFDEHNDNDNEQDKVHLQPRGGQAEREAGQEHRQDEPLGEGQRHDDGQPDKERVDRRGEPHPGADGKRGGGVPQSSDSEKGAADVAQQPKNTRNNHGERGVDYAPKGVDARIDANFAAIELAQQLLERGEQATPEQMATLRKFSGWGGLGEAFNEGAWDGAKRRRNERLKQLLGEKAYNDAVMSANSSFYTPATVIDALWDVARQAGFKGGRVLEGSAGIGNILSQMPTDMSGRSDIEAVEIDPTAGGILSLLYPDATVHVQGFEQAKVANGSVDLAITNVPFVTGLQVRDTTGDQDLAKKFPNIHDFCIAKNVRKLREGGLGIFITSSGTLDSSQKLRNWLVAEGNADVVGAFRLNNRTFGGTSVTSDIIVVRKRVNGKPSAHAIDVSTVGAERTATLSVQDSRGRTATKDVALNYNRYYMEHPEMMAGEMFFGGEKGDTYRPTSKGLYPVEGKEQGKMLQAFVESLADLADETPTNAPTVEQQTAMRYEKLGENVKEGSLVVDGNGMVCQAMHGVAKPLMSAPNKKKNEVLGENITEAELIERYQKPKIKGHTKAECFRSYTAIKDAVSAVLDYQATHEDDTGLKPLLRQLNKAYDDFVATYGHLHKNNQLAFLKYDVDYPSVLALETFSETGDKKGDRVQTFGKGDIFSQRVLEKATEPHPTTVKDCVVVSIQRQGRIDIPYMAQLLGKDEQEMRREVLSGGLGFEDPATGEVEVSFKYKSGNVREKLRQARENNADGRYDANVKALEAVVPMDIPAHLIEFTLGSSWIAPKLYEDYVEERTDIKLNLSLVGGSWLVKEPYYINKEKNLSAGVRSELLGKTVYGHELIVAALQNKTVVVSKTEKHWDGHTETTTDREASAACAAKIDEIRQDFKDWARQRMLQDTALSEEMERVYNEQFNNYVPLSIPEDFVPRFFEGANHRFTLRPHQGAAAVRATMQPLMLAHEVGTGKTFTLITTAMEMRRLGTAKKPMIVVQNATVGQFVADAKALYPNAKILTLSDKDKNAAGRQDFYAKIRYNDWDMVVVPQSTLELIPDSRERQMAFVQDKIEEKMLVLEQMRNAQPGGKDPAIGRAEKELEKLRDELAQIAGGEGKKGKDLKREAKTRQNAEVKAWDMLDRKTDDTLDFDAMGIDALLVDEAHEYKHLGFATAMQRGVKGVDSSYSKKSQGVYLKVQSVLEKSHGRNVVFATGTPISNTAAEVWTFMRYLMPADTMKEYGIYYFDDFVRNFGNIQQMAEFGANGKFKEVNRFAGYSNLPELVRLWLSVADTVKTEDNPELQDKIPRTEAGVEGDPFKAQDIYLPQTKALRSVMKYVKERLDEFEKMSGAQKRENSALPLKMYNIAKAAAVDARLVVDDAADDPNSKTNEAVRQTLRSLADTKDYKGTVAIFADNYQNKHSGFNLYEEIRRKLVEQGVPASQVAIIKGGMTINAKQDIFDKVNRGEVRVVLGSTFTLGTGVNIQERLHTLIHLDAPTRPMDYTQRNGRILRQGNLHRKWGKTVRVLRFGVEDSLDVTAYQRLKTKAAIANSIMDGNKLLANSMENRYVEEEADVFGDTVAQLSGSEYAMLKNQAEREVRKLEAKMKQWEADQIYIHNQEPRLQGQIKSDTERGERNRKLQGEVEAHFPDGQFKRIAAGKEAFDSVDAMGDYFKAYNKGVAEAMEKVKTDGGTQTRKLTLDIDGYPFEVLTVVEREMGQDGATLFSKATRTMTYSCERLGLKDVAVKNGYLKNAVEDIVANVITGNDFRERAEHAEAAAERERGELAQLQRRKGGTFAEAEALEKAKQLLDEYTEKMKKELAAKEAKYAELDAQVETATDVREAEEDSEEAHEDEVRELRIGDEADALTEEETALRDELADRLRSAGIEVITDTEEGQRVLDMAGGADGNRELADIIAKAKADGTYMKAPNGKPTKLNERQWAQVRTKAFKEWFGDWERTARIAKLRESNPIVSTGKEYEGKYELDNKSAATYINNELRGEYVNKDTNTPIKITRKGAFKVTRHDAENEAHLKSIALIPQMLENAIFISEEPNAKGKNGYDSYRYYVVGLRMNGVDYTAKLVVGEKNGETYYDHALTEIEKTALIDGRDEISSSFTTDEAVNSVGKDKRLFSILQANSSKVVDENGEPLVVYHGTREDFTVFDLGKALSGRAFWFADRNAQEYNLVEYCGQGMEDLRLMPLFANIKNPAEGIEVSDATDDQDGGFVVVDPQKYDQGTLDELKDELGERYDEFVNGGKIATAGFVLSPNQLKSATDNVGGFSRTNDDIREQRVYHGSGADFDAFDHSHMGEGEGAQAYGWGTYVTEVEGIGRNYAKAVRNKGVTVQVRENGVWREIDKSSSDYSVSQDVAQLIGDNGNYKEAVRFADRWRDIANAEEIRNHWQAVYDFLKAHKAKDIKVKEDRHLYTVEIPDDNGSNYLDWDKRAGTRILNKVAKAIDADEAAKTAVLSRARLFPSILDTGNTAQALYGLMEYDGTTVQKHTGHDLYEVLEMAFGSDKAASEFLSKAGFTGIKYPADYRRGGRADGAKNYVIFNEADAKITDHVRFFRTPSGESYGFTVGGRIYLDPRVATAETPIHEYAHLWASALRQGNAEEWRNVVGLMKGTGVWDEVRRAYPELESDDDIADEVLAHYSGRRGAQRLREEQRKIAEGEGSVTEKAAAISALERVRQALKRFWKGVADFLHIHYTTAEEVADRVLGDLLEGVNPTEYASPEQLAATEASVRHHKETDKATLERLNSEPTIMRYRAMQLIDGKLYPPMSAKVGKRMREPSELGVWERSDEQPELTDSKGRFKLQKGGKDAEGKKLGDVPAAYNPYFHTSTSPLNDQFSTAYKRPNLVVVEVEIPASELTSGYRAEGAKDSVGEVAWHSGVVNGQLPEAKKRKVMLTRWAKPVRIVDDAECADIIAKTLEGEDVTVPSNTVTPSLRAELEKRGVAVEDKDGGKLFRDGGSSLEVVNGRFNEQLSTLTEENADNVTLTLGTPSDVLLAAGVEDKPMKLYGNKVMKKMRKHGFTLSELQDLPKAVAAPIAVFDNYKKSGSRSILTELKTAQGNFLVTLNVGKGEDIDFNIVASVFGKGEDNIVDWIERGLATYIDKEKALDYLHHSALIAEALSSPRLVSAANVVRNFENPRISDEKLREVADFGEGREIPIKFIYGGNYVVTDGSLRGEYPSKEQLLDAFRSKYPQYLTTIEDRGEDGEVLSVKPTTWGGGKLTAARRRAQAGYLERKHRRMENAAHAYAKTLGVAGVEVLTTTEGLQGRKARAKGWYDPRTGKVTIVLPNHRDSWDVRSTMFHEVVAHLGLRKLVGEAAFNDFLDNVYNNASIPIQREIDRLTERYGDRRTATEEYMAQLAEDMDFDSNAEHKSWWMRIKEFALSMLRKAGINLGFKLTDNELRYILWRSWKNLTEPGARNIFTEAEDIATQQRMKVGDYRRGGEVTAEVADGAIRFRESTDRDRLQVRDEYERAVSTAAHKFTLAWQDSMAGLDELQKAIENAAGRKLFDWENAYMAENRMSSTNLAEMEAYKATFYKDMVSAINELVRDGVAYDSVVAYALAKHGLERNVVLAFRDAVEAENADHKARKAAYNAYEADPDRQRNEADFEQGIVDYAAYRAVDDAIRSRYATGYADNRSRDYSGLTALFDTPDVVDAEAMAADMVAQVEGQHKPLTDALWRRVNAATDAALVKQRESGLMTKARYDGIKGMFKNYIPLKGFDETTSDEVYSYYADRSNRIGGKLDQRAKGRKSLADDPFATIGNDMERAIVQGNRNRMKQHFLKMAINNPSDAVSVSELYLRKDDATGEWVPQFADTNPTDDAATVEQKVEAWNARMEQLCQSAPEHYMRSKDAPNVPYRVINGNMREHQVLVKMLGKAYVLTINGNPEAAQALNGLTNPDTSEGIQRFFTTANHFMAAMFTQKNPAFLISNLSRDAFFANSMVWVKESPTYAWQFNRNWGSSLVRLGGLISKQKSHTLNPADKWEGYFAEFIANGGETGYTFMNSVDDYKGVIADLLKQSQRSDMDPRTWLHFLNESIDFLGRWTEDTSRFAAYVTSREMGRSVERSILDAKEITVNFNRKGAGAKAAGKWEKGNRLNYINAAVLAQNARNMYVFFNAGVQGVQNFTGAARKHKGKAAAMAGLYTLAGVLLPWAMTALASALGGDDGDDDYWNLPDYTRRNNLCIYTGSGWATIPLPIELRAFYGLGETLFGQTAGKKRLSAKETLTTVAGLMSQIMPLDVVEGGAMTFVPSYAKPLVEIGVNKDWTGMPIYRRNDHNKDMPEWTKAYSGTNQTLVKLAETLNEISGGTKYDTGTIDVNPAAVEHIFEGYLGGVGKFVNKTWKTASMAWDEDARELRNVPIIGNFYRTADERTQGRAITEQYYDYYDEYLKTQQRVRGYEDEADKGVLEYAEKLDFLYNSKEYLRYEIMQDYIPDINELRKEADETQDETERRELQQELMELRRECVEELKATEK